MTLPTINIPTYELEIPSTKEKIIYRPFLVKEEKILLLALEENKEEAIARALKQIVFNCTFEILDLERMPLFDLEYIFLNIRSKSVGEVAELKLLCPDDNKTYADVSIPLEDIKVDFKKEHTNVIKLTDTLAIVMKYPTYEVLGMDPESMTIDKTFKLIASCTDKVVDGETVYERTDFTEKEIESFYEGLNTKQFEDIQNFFETMPRLRYEVEFENPKTKKKNKVTLEGLQSFFG